MYSEEKSIQSGELFVFIKIPMKNILYTLISFVTSILVEHVFAADNNAGILGG